MNEARSPDRGHLLDERSKHAVSKIDLLGVKRERELLVEPGSALVDAPENLSTARREVKHRGGPVLGVRPEDHEPGFCEIVGDPLDGLAGDAEPTGGLWNGAPMVGDDAQQLPARLGLALSMCQYVADPSKQRGSLVDVGDQEREFLRPRRIDKVLSI